MEIYFLNQGHIEMDSEGANTLTAKSTNLL